jgi:hypothetical protein
MTNTVHLLWFIPEGDEYMEDALLIGVYESETAAKAAIERLRNKPGFVDYPAGFQIHPHRLGQDNWTEGFIRD